MPPMQSPQLGAMSTMTLPASPPTGSLNLSSFSRGNSPFTGGNFGQQITGPKGPFFASSDSGAPQSQQPYQQFQATPQVFDSIDRAQSERRPLANPFGIEDSDFRDASTGTHAANADAESKSRLDAEAAKLRRMQQRLALEFQLHQQREDNSQRQPAIAREWWKKESAARIRLAKEVGKLREEYASLKAELDDAREVIRIYNGQQVEKQDQLRYDQYVQNTSVWQHCLRDVFTSLSSLNIDIDMPEDGDEFRDILVAVIPMLTKYYDPIVGINEFIDQAQPGETYCFNHIISRFKSDDDFPPFEPSSCPSCSKQDDESCFKIECLPRSAGEKKTYNFPSVQGPKP
ncbi:hypothetical protein BDP81DRAFT_493528 [Colletotrichum phormii]|uniref:Uncharacterized protein n=1 Tax=Colletotrichum phormii TaxID=359342 RepID=A0AAI9ZLN9_9PEZI|nr:uncharacterized protein BDP81DRAFT_493528 [Colletotrichum phormii]KAK1634287.1 hypothetical protein BDP81DRAFT_493528 [Colletotrichum phormii]